MRPLRSAAPDGGTSLWLANLRDTPQRVVLPEATGGALVARLDEATFEAAATDPAFMQASATAQTTREIEIGAHGVVHIQIEG